MKILLLEDDFTLSKEIATFFASKSFEYTPFYDGLLLLKKYKPFCFRKYRISSLKSYNHLFFNIKKASSQIRNGAFSSVKYSIL